MEITAQKRHSSNNSLNATNIKLPAQHLHGKNSPAPSELIEATPTTKLASAPSSGNNKEEIKIIINEVLSGSPVSSPKLFLDLNDNNSNNVRPLITSQFIKNNAKNTAAKYLNTNGNCAENNGAAADGGGGGKLLTMLTGNSVSTTPSVSSQSVSTASSTSVSTSTLPQLPQLIITANKSKCVDSPCDSLSTRHLLMVAGNGAGGGSDTASMISSSSRHHNQTHHHNHGSRHRHSHHHRNYASNRNLAGTANGAALAVVGSNDPGMANESADDPDSVSIPVLQLTDSFFNLEAKESNDYDDDDDDDREDQNNDDDDDAIKTDTMTLENECNNNNINSEIERHSNESKKENNENTSADTSRQSDDSMAQLHQVSASNRSSMNKSIRHHRSTPNLATLNDLNIGDYLPLITGPDLNEITLVGSINSTTGEVSGGASGATLKTGMPNGTTANAANNNNNTNNNNNNLINNSYPSNLELSTINHSLYDLQRSIILTNAKMSNGKLNQKLNLIINNNNLHGSSATGNCSNLTNLINNLNGNGKKFAQRYKLLIEGDVHVCKLPHSRNVISKILNSKLLRRWKAHRIILTDTEIYSTTQTDYMDSSIPYHTIVEVSPISKWEPGQKYCLRVATIECHYLIQTNNIYVRDQWIHSIIWKKHKFKSERVLRSAVRPEILIKEIKNMIDMSLTTPIEDCEIYQYPLELISEILQKHHLPKATHEEVIVSLSPLLEKNHPSPEICDFFSRHCRDSPRSHIVIEMFSPVVQRILKHNGDFGRYPRMRMFVQDYLMALISQNDGLQTVQNFVISMHSPSSQCPFPRVLPNFVAVCLAAIHGCFEQRKNYKNNNPPAVQLSEQEQEDQLVCHTTMMLTMSKFEDWRVNLAQLLQSVPFPDQALTHDKFIKIFKKVVENFALDQRCEVHQTLLGIREGKEGWFEIFCPGGISCDDDGELFSTMLQTLIGCCCKKKRFLLSINKLLSQIMILAVREVPCAIETLCAMLDLNGVENPDNKLQIISTLQSTQLGLKMYAKVCERQMQLRELQQKGGPRKLTLPSRSTDEDLAKLLLSGSFGNLECLSLAFTNVTSACAEYLIKLPSLRYLNLWSTKFGDEGLELISEHLQRLQVLNLCETPVTDKGLACLASMKQLRKLNLNSTNLSALTFEGLKECLPALQECDIRYTDAW